MDCAGLLRPPRRQLILANVQHFWNVYFFFFSVASAVIDRGFHVISSLPRLLHTPPLSPPSTICIFFYYAPRPDSRILPTFFGKTLEISRDWRVPGLSGYHSLRFDCKNMSFFFLLGQAILAAIYYMSFFLWMIYRFTMGILFCESCPLIVIWAHSL